MVLDGSKASPNDDVSVSILKSAVGIHFPYITDIINSSIEEVHVSDELKLAEVSPILKKMN